MSIPNLPVNFKDDILNTGVNQKRKYQQTYNSDGSVSFEDVTAYQQKGSNFGAQEVNKTNEAVNNIYSERVVDLDALELITEPGFFVDALAVKDAYTELNENSVILERTDIISDSPYSYEYFIYREKNTRYIKMFGKWVGTATGTSLGEIYYGNISNLRLIPSIQGVTLERIINIIFAGGNSGSIFAPANYNGASIFGNIANVSTINYLMTSPPRETTLTWEILCKIA